MIPMHNKIYASPEVSFSGDSAIISWGKGARRSVFETSKTIAMAIVRYRGEAEIDSISEWIKNEANIDNGEAKSIAIFLLEEGYLSNYLTPGEIIWDELGWSDAASIFNAAYDTRWVHDYRGNPVAMVRDANGTNFGVSGDKPVGAWEYYVGIDIPLPDPIYAEKSMVDVLEKRRTHRKFKPGSSNISDISTIFRWTFGRQKNDKSRFVSHTYVESGPVLGFVVIDRNILNIDKWVGEKDGRFALGIYIPESHSIRIFDTTDRIGAWSDLLWTQGYGGDASFALIMVSDVRNYLRKYPNARSYNWMSSDAGAFMQTAIVAASGIGLNAFQTPAMDDDLVSQILNLDKSDSAPSYFALFGR